MTSEDDAFHDRSSSFQASATESVRAYFLELQDSVEIFLLEEDGSLSVRHDQWQRDGGAKGGGETRILTDGALFEKAAVNFSDVRGDALPNAALSRRPNFAGCPYRAMGVSVVIHPRNPYVPISHLNVRYFETTKSDETIWWFGGGFDLTPCYPFLEDAIQWHSIARDACEPFATDLYPRLKRWCDEYFFLKHRQEARGIGGLFFDDFTEGGFQNAFGFARSIGKHFLEAYRPIVSRRRSTPYGDRERTFQRFRRGRYVEFNLLYDRGTLFGLQSGGRVESILASLPPEAGWSYDYHVDDSAAAHLNAFLQPRDWLSEAGL